MSLVRVLEKSSDFSAQKLSQISFNTGVQTYDLGNYIGFIIMTPEGERRTRKKIISCGCHKIRLNNTAMITLIEKLGKKYEFRDFECGLDTFNRNNLEDSDENMEYYQVIFNYLAHKQSIQDVIQAIKRNYEDWEADIVEITINENIFLHELIEIYRNLIFKIPVKEKETESLRFIQEVLHIIKKSQ